MYLATMACFSTVIQYYIKLYPYCLTITSTFKLAYYEPQYEKTFFGHTQNLCAVFELIYYIVSVDWIVNSI